MPKKSEYSGSIHLRLTAAQDTFVRDIADLHDAKPSDVVRALIEDARQNHVADEAIRVLSPHLEEVGHAADQC